MNNEAIAVKCSLHGPQIVWQRQSSSYTRIHSNYCRPWERSWRMHTSHVKLITNMRRPVSVKELYIELSLCSHQIVFTVLQCTSNVCVLNNAHM